MAHAFFAGKCFFTDFIRRISFFYLIFAFALLLNMNLKYHSRALLLCVALLTTYLVATGQPRLVAMGENQDSITFDSVVALGLPVLDIVTDGGEWPTCDYVEAPDMNWGISITNAKKVPGRMTIVTTDGITYDSGDYLESVRGMTIRIRGNSSAYQDKKPYKIDLQDKADLLDRHNPNYRDKDWSLICDDHFFAFVGFELGRMMNILWTPGFRYVNVVINDSYQGMYLLIETVKRNTTCRLNVTKKGFIFENDPYWWNDQQYIPSTLFPMMNFTFKYPSDDDMTTSDKQYITQVLNDFEQSITDGSYPDHIDVPSFAKWCLVHDIMGSWDAGGSNRYMVKYDRNTSSKITVACLWDFDSSEQEPELFSRCHRFLYAPFFMNKNRTFVETYINLWNSLSPQLIKQMQTTVDNFKLSDDGKGVIASFPLSATRWGNSGTATVKLNNRMRWMRERIPWLQQAIYELNPTGDVNIDAMVDVTDVSILIDMVLGKQDINWRVADINGDGNVDVTDVNMVIDIILAGRTDEPQ